MKKSEMSREQISALADGELDANECDQALTGLRDSETGKDWELYHAIGDVLRSEDVPFRLSASFSDTFAARLAAEPIHIAPLMPRRHFLPVRTLRNLGVAAAVAGFAFVMTPPLLDVLQPQDGGSELAATVVPSAPPQIEPVAGSNVEVILRDPRIDDYLIAHQRFSPAVSGGASYARDAAYSGK